MLTLKKLIMVPGHAQQRQQNYLSNKYRRQALILLLDCRFHDRLTGRFSSLTGTGTWQTSNTFGGL